MPLKIIFMGTPQFSIPALDLLFQSHHKIINVYTQPPKKSRRGQKINISPVYEFSKKNNLHCRSPENLNNNEEYQVLKKLSPDLVVVVAYGKIIPKNFLNIAKFGFINIHASLLPKWRGAAPIQRAIMNRDEKIGVSIMKIEEKLDEGPILSVKEIKLEQNATCDEIENKLAKMGADLLIQSLKNIEDGNAEFSKQVHSDATYAKKINKNETKIDWNQSAKKVVGQIHGLSSNPGAWFKYENERFKVLRVRKSSLSGKPGEILDNALTVGCKADSIQILEIQREGKKRQSAKDFLLGKKIDQDSTLN